MTTPPSIFHAFLRPSILQILRSTGYHSTKPAVLDSLTDLAVRYLSILCEGTASHATHNHGNAGDFTIVDIRMALQDAGAMSPQRITSEENWLQREDLRGVEEFVNWFSGQKMKEMMEFGNGDGEHEATDYLNALKKKHHNTGEDTKYYGTILGKGNETGETYVQVEGGPETSIHEWISKRSKSKVAPLVNGVSYEDEDDDDDIEINGDRQRSLSSGLSSVGDLVGEDGMDLS